MSLEDWLHRMRQTVSRVEERLEDASRAAAATVTEGYSGCELVSVTVDGTGRLAAIRFEPGCFDEHDADSLRDAVVETYNLTKRQWPIDRRADFDAAYAKERLT